MCWELLIPSAILEGIYTRKLTTDYSIEMGKRSTKLDLPAVFPHLQVMDLLYRQVPMASLYMERLKN
ncbi:hypothetical protein L2D08_21475 [Domibacillus sp. PGB-M46]|uniref:hypothetical protein n=1 Tax=Domibacillus sp. PGB-M46 TaxID=2910255 RepID=UPI001F5A6E0E|nr:hypothetical protein [Domibacillus sp. PGB-M46]MCI2256903.1 hypothetical protein [Domibacillus sp. PGB-M46]